MKKKKFVFSLLSAVFVLTAVLSYSKGVSKDLAQNILRLHILANSDSENDQQIKNAVRDRVLCESRKLFAGSKSLEETKRILSESKNILKKAAEDEIKRLGFSYPVNIKTGLYDFPMKTYDKYSLPSGKYEAVRIEIGEGAGANWWCVMFPPLCFVDAVSDAQKADEYMSENLRDDEVALITTDEGFDIRFRIVDMIGASMKGIRTALNR